MNTQNLKCPKCDKELDLRGVTPGEVHSKGDGFMCTCGFIGEFTDEGLRELSREDLTAMSPDERADMNFAARCMNIPFNGS